MYIFVYLYDIYLQLSRINYLNPSLTPSTFANF